MNIFIRAFFKEFLGNFTLGIGLFSLFFFFGESAKLLELALLVSGESARLFISSLLNLYARYWISMSGFIIPMGFLMGITLTLSRMQEDRELLAFETLGIHINKWLAGIALAAGILFVFIQSPLAGRYMPKSRFVLKRFAYESRSLVQNLTLSPGTWAELGSARLLARRAEGKQLEEVTLFVEGNDSGKEGSVYRVEGRTAEYEVIPEDHQHSRLRILFRKGSLAIPDRENPGDMTHCDFETYENFIPLTYPASLTRTWREHTNRELWKMRREPGRYDLKKNQRKDIAYEHESRLNLILSPLVLALVSLYACQKFRGLTRGFGFGLALTLLSSYWIVMVLCSSLRIPLAANVLYAALAIPILWLIR